MAGVFKLLWYALLYVYLPLCFLVFAWEQQHLVLYFIKSPLFYLFGH
jgi:hypothetical protein